MSEAWNEPPEKREMRKSLDELLPRQDALAKDPETSDPNSVSGQELRSVNAQIRKLRKLLQS